MLVLAQELILRSVIKICSKINEDLLLQNERIGFEDVAALVSEELKCEQVI